ncbi:MAG: hypothetical protein JXB13_03495 [Phycisphaerae bacterium]|nr:hypothetical protein [Phycisphaerae bacterium]
MDDHPAASHAASKQPPLCEPDADPPPGELCVHCGKIVPLPVKEGGNAKGWFAVLWPGGEILAWLIVLGSASLLALGLCVGALVLFVVALVVWRVYFPRRCPWCRQWQRAQAVRRWKRGHCVNCGYNLTGNVSGVCPECGTPIAREARSVSADRPVPLP